MNKFGRWLRGKREGQGMTQPQLAAKAGMSDSYISALEVGTRQGPSYKRVKALADALGADLEEALVEAGIKLPDETIDTIGIPLLDAIKRDKILSPRTKELWTQFYKELYNLKVEIGKQDEHDVE